jgi:galactose mutarotase-like enzyme
MTQHGFARDMEFKNVECGVSEAEFVMSASQETFRHFPFCFELRVRYKVEENKVTISYFVKNDDRQDMYFSIGAHPGFETKNLSNYEIQFETNEKEYYSLKNGLIDWENPKPFGSQSIKPDEALFKNDALIFNKIKSRYIDLVDTKRLETIRLRANCPYWGIWGKENVPFICLEPWFGVGDSTSHDKNFETKNGIITLPMGEIFGFSYSIEVKVHQPNVVLEKKK